MNGPAGNGRTPRRSWMPGRGFPWGANGAGQHFAKSRICAYLHAHSVELIARNWTSFQCFGYSGVMTLTRLQLRLLVALLDLAQADQPANVRLLAERLDVRLGVVATQLGILDELGLVHAARLRLSLEGLAVAALGRARLRAATRAVSVAA